MERLNQTSGLIVRQQKEWGEILTGFETRNRYEVMDSEGNPLFSAGEESGVLVRMFLKGHRPFTIHIVDAGGGEVLAVQRHFRFYFHQVTVRTADGRLLGKVRREFKMIGRRYTVLDGDDREVFALVGPLFHPWTFQIMDGERELGKITKKWSGMLKEGFTDADNFGVLYPADWPSDLKALFLGAVFLIDFVHFETSK